MPLPLFPVTSDTLKIRRRAYAVRHRRAAFPADSGNILSVLDFGEQLAAPSFGYVPDHFLGRAAEREHGASRRSNPRSIPRPRVTTLA